MYVEGRIVQDQKRVFAVPEDAIIKEGEQFFIFILVEDGEEEENTMKFKMIPVIIGITDLGYVEINLQTENPENIRVVTKGAYTLSSEMIKGELGHDD
jgi:cobalt-zinc-cadmium efflux system membrane fusion protein